ncbi:hypothetical protein BDW69DRAFT_168654 [Aspergillus filifer]
MREKDLGLNSHVARKAASETMGRHILTGWRRKYTSDSMDLDDIEAELVGSPASFGFESFGSGQGKFLFYVPGAEDQSQQVGDEVDDVEEMTGNDPGRIGPDDDTANAITDLISNEVQDSFAPGDDSEISDEVEANNQPDEAYGDALESFPCPFSDFDKDHESAPRLRRHLRSCRQKTEEGVKGLVPPTARELSVKVKKAALGARRLGSRKRRFSL